MVVGYLSLRTLHPRIARQRSMRLAISYYQIFFRSLATIEVYSRNLNCIRFSILIIDFSNRLLHIRYLRLNIFSNIENLTVKSL